MKNFISFITILIIAHTTTYYMISTEAQEKFPVPVLDMDGNNLQSDNSYYVRPRTRPGGGSGIVPYPMQNEICTYGVAQLLYGPGIPLTFHQPSSVLGSPIYEHIDLNITFAVSTGCNSTDVWRRGEYHEATGQYFVMIGGDSDAGNPKSGKTLGNAFQIRKVVDEDDYYKFVYCPRTCISCLEICDDVGIFRQDGVRRLALSGDNSDNTFYIKFQKIHPNTRGTDDGVLASAVSFF